MKGTNHITHRLVSIYLIFYMRFRHSWKRETTTDWITFSQQYLHYIYKTMEWSYGHNTPNHCTMCTKIINPICVEFSPGENFHTFRHPLSLVKLYHVNFYHALKIANRIWRPLLYWQKFFPQNFSVIQRYLGLVKFLSSKNFHAYRT